MIRSSFYGYTTAQTALAAAQKALDVVGHNMSNVNTPGYTRQRLDLYSSSSGGHKDRYATQFGANVGQGVTIGGVSQIRDPFLDLRFRSEIGKVGEQDAILGALNDLEDVFDEISSDGLSNQISDLVSQLNKYTSSSESVIKASADTLTRLFNNYAKQVQKIKENAEHSLEQVDIPAVNNLLKGIANLNESIRTDQLNGNPSLELLDQRNTMLDELSTYVKVDIKYTPNEISPGIFVEDVTITMRDSANAIPLVDNDKYADFKYNSTTRELSVGNADPASRVNVQDDLTTGSLKGSIDMLTKEGIYNDRTTRGVKYYEKILDTFANKIADTMNKANSFTAEEALAMGWTEAAVDRPLFEFGGDGSKTAANLKIADDWSNGKHGITNTKVKDPAGGTGDSDSALATDNILKMIGIFTDKTTQFKTPDDNPDPNVDTSKVIFTGTLQQCFGQATEVLTSDIDTANKMYKNYSAVAGGISDAIAGVSGVSLDEEGMDMMKYQKSYNAAARLMTTMDEAIDTIINKMGLVGR